MNGFNDLKEKLEAQGIAVSKNDGLNSSANLNSAASKNGSPNSNSAVNSNPSVLNLKNKVKNAEFESIAEKEKRLRAEFIEFVKGEDILK